MGIIKEEDVEFAKISSKELLAQEGASCDVSFKAVSTMAAKKTALEQKFMEEWLLQFTSDPNSRNPLLQSYILFAQDIPANFRMTNDLSIKYSVAMDAIKSIEYSIDDVVNMFDIVNIGLVSYRFGLFSSAALNNKMKDDDVVKIGIKQPIDLLCIFQERGHIIINGDVGICGAYNHKGGIIELKGNVGQYFANKMEGGTISIDGHLGTYGFEFMSGGDATVFGSVGSYSFSEMSGGIANIKANINDNFARKMTGGLIRVIGNIESFGKNRIGGGIYQNGVLISLPQPKPESAVAAQVSGPYSADPASFNPKDPKFQAPETD